MPIYVKKSFKKVPTTALFAYKSGPEYSIVLKIIMLHITVNTLHSVYTLKLTGLVTLKAIAVFKMHFMRWHILLTPALLSTLR